MLFSRVQVTLIKIPLMISFKVWSPSVQFLRTSPVNPIYLSVTSTACVLLELQLQPFPLIYQAFDLPILQFDIFLQNLKLPLLFSLLSLLIKNMHLLQLLSLLTHHMKKVLVLPLLQHSLFHQIRTVTELFQFLVPFYVPIVWLVRLIL